MTYDHFFFGVLIWATTKVSYTDGLAYQMCSLHIATYIYMDTRQKTNTYKDRTKQSIQEQTYIAMHFKKLHWNEKKCGTEGKMAWQLHDVIKRWIHITVMIDHDGRRWCFDPYILR